MNKMDQCSDLHLGYKSSWYTADEKDDFVSELHPGDLIEFRRGIGAYHHWAVFAGDSFSPSDHLTPQVFHAGSAPRFNFGNVFFGSMSLDKSRHGIGAVQMDPLFEVWGTSDARINNKLDDKYVPFECSKVVVRALERIENQRVYNFVTNNCEHFAKWCRNGVSESMQSQVSLKTGFTTAVSFGCVAVLGAVVMLLQMKEEFEDECLFSDGVDQAFEDDQEEDGKKQKYMLRQTSISLD